MLAHKGQFIALIVLVAIGIMSFVTFQNGYYNLKASLDHAYTTLRFADFTVRVERMPLTAARAVERIPGVATARVRTVERRRTRARRTGTRRPRASSARPDRRRSSTPSTSRQGRFPADAARDEVLLSTQFATDTDTRLGDQLTLLVGGRAQARPRRRYRHRPREPVRHAERGRPCPLPAPSRSSTRPRAGSSSLFGTAHSGNDIAVKAQPGVDLDDLAEDVEDELRPYGLVSTALREDMPSYAGLESELEQNRLMARSLPVLVLAISSMSLFIALSRLVQAQRGEIGLAKALGYSDRPDSDPLPDRRDDSRGGRVDSRRRARAVGSAGRRSDVRVDARFAVHDQRLLPARCRHRRSTGGALVRRRGRDARMEVGTSGPGDRHALRSQPLARRRAHPGRGARALPHPPAFVHLPSAAAQRLPGQAPQPSTPCSASRSRWCSRWPRSRCSTRSTTSWTRRSPTSSGGTSWRRSTHRSALLGSPRSAT